MLKIAICDDDQGCCGQLEEILRDYAKKEKLDMRIQVFYSAEDMLASLREGNLYDVVYLDIRLPQRSGVELGHALRQIRDRDAMSLFFISGETDRCMELFELEPVNFYHKPLDEKIIRRDMDKVVRRSGSARKSLNYTENGIVRGIPLGDVLYAEALRKRVVIHLRNTSETVTIRKTLRELEQEYGALDFCLCHRSYLVNVSRVVKARGGYFTMENGDRIPLGDKYRYSAIEKWQRYLLGEN